MAVNSTTSVSEYQDVSSESYIAAKGWGGANIGDMSMALDASQVGGRQNLVGVGAN